MSMNSLSVDQVDVPYRVLKLRVGAITTIPDWPTPDLNGLIKALKEWTLYPGFDMSGTDPEHPHVAFEKPYRCLAWGHCITEPIKGQVYRKRYVGTKPIYENHPNAVSYCGNFLTYSFGFQLDTDDEALIQLLDQLISTNMATPAYQEALRDHREMQNFWRGHKR